MSRANAPAFPFVVSQNQPNQVCEGLTVREWFTGMAMQGLLANRTEEEKRCFVFSIVAGEALIMADAMIERLNQ